MKNVLNLPTQRLIYIGSLLGFAFGSILFLWPSFVQSVLLTSGGDGVTWHIGRCVGAQILCVSWLLYKISSSKDHTTFATVFHLLFLISVFTLAVSIHAKVYYLKHVYLVSLYIIITMSIAGLLFTLWQLYRLGFPVGLSLTMRDALPRTLILLDSFAALLVGTMWIAFPEWILHKQVTGLLDGSHLYVARLMGCMFSATQIVSTQAIYWKNRDDRNTWAHARCIMCYGLLSAQLYSQVGYGAWWRGTHWVGISFCSLWGSIVTIYTYLAHTGTF